MFLRCAYNAQTESLVAVLFLREEFPIFFALEAEYGATDEVGYELEGGDFALKELEDEDGACEEPNEDLEASLPEFEEAQYFPLSFWSQCRKSRFMTCVRRSVSVSGRPV